MVTYDFVLFYVVYILYSKFNNWLVNWVLGF